MATAAWLEWAAPTMAAKPGIRPSTNWIPQERNWMSSIGAVQVPARPLLLSQTPDW
jgi:hypothetical protein